MTVQLRLSPGDIFASDYQVIRPLSAGGMGAVYCVEQLSTGLHRALKLMHAALSSDEGFRRRFEQEAKISGRIASDHVVQVIAAGVDTASNTPWIAMELLDGEELGDWARKRTVTTPDVIEVFRQLCHALGAAHSQGIVHRDLKPENIFICKPRRDGIAFTLKVLDFGIAKVLRSGNVGTTQSIGTPLWMAPEQMGGGGISTASDVWPLGLLAFWLLTGKLYWTTAGSETPEPVLRETLLGPIVPASDRAAELGSSQQLPDSFNRWFARCVVRSPDARFADAAEAGRVLAQALTEVVPPVVDVTIALPDSPSPFGVNVTAVAPASSAPRHVPHTAPMAPDLRRGSPAVSPQAKPLPGPPRAAKLPWLIGGAVAFTALAGLVLAIRSWGQEVNRRCPDGLALEADGTCPACPTGQHRVPGHGCATDTVTASASCPAGFTLVNAQCVCADGRPPMPGASCNSAGCPEGSSPDLAGECRCGNGQTPVDGKCPELCPPGLLAVGGKCLCPDGSPLTQRGCPTTRVAAVPASSPALSTAGVQRSPGPASQGTPLQAPVATPPPPLDQSIVMAVLEKGERSARGSCSDAALAEPEGTVTVRFAPAGNVAGASVSGPMVGTRAASCVERVFRALKVPAFAGGDRSFQKPIVLE